jgi:hypothetical protein
MEAKRTIQIINPKQKSWFFEKLNKIYKPLAKLNNNNKKEVEDINQ